MNAITQLLDRYRKMTERQRLSFWMSISAGFVIAVIIGVALVGAPKFRTYYRPTQGFKIQYPKHWEMKENYEGAAVVFLSPRESGLDFYPENVSVVIQDFPDHPMTLDQYTSIAIDQLKAVFKKYAEILDSSPTALSGRSAHKLYYIGKGIDGTRLKILHIWTVKGTKAYQITYTANASQYDLYYPEVDKMIKSFQIY